MWNWHWIILMLMLYSHIQLYVYIYNYMRKHSQHNLRTSMNERTHFFIKNIPLTIYPRKGCERVAKGLMLVMCEGWAGDPLLSTYNVRVHLGILVMKGYSPFAKRYITEISSSDAISCLIQNIRSVGSYPMLRCSRYFQSWPKWQNYSFDRWTV